MYNRNCEAGIDMPAQESMKYDMGVKKEMKFEHMENGDVFPGVVCPPIYECPVEKVCHREICHEVPHIQPVNTRIINHHIYKHSFQPCFSCCEENVCTNVYECPCQPCCNPCGRRF